jgi:hypothetical protein
MRRKLLEFFLLARYVRIPDHGGELGGDLVSAKHSVYAGRVRAVAAARSTGLRPIHFIHFIAATVTNRGRNLLKEYAIITRL